MIMVHKVTLNFNSHQSITVPIDAKFISVINQRGVPVLYYTTDLETKEMTTRNVLLLVTGNKEDQFEERYPNFVGTVSFLNCEYIVHIFTD